MSRRSPARFLAPLALVAVSVALFAVLSGGGATAEREAAPGSAAPAGTATSEEESKTDKPRTKRRRYTVKPGDTPSGIAEKTGISVQDLLDLNPDLDPQSLVPGTRLKLR